MFVQIYANMYIFDYSKQKLAINGLSLHFMETMKIVANHIICYAAVFTYYAQYYVKICA